jgi:hypothetical protein
VPKPPQIPLLTGQLTGDFADLGPLRRFSRLIVELIQRVADKLPTQTKQGSFWRHNRAFFQRTGDFRAGARELDLDFFDPTRLRTCCGSCTHVAAMALLTAIEMLPAAIADIADFAYENKAVIYDLLFKASAETLSSHYL